MVILKKFISWLSVVPSKDDLFFVHVRESYQAIKKIRHLPPTNKEMDLYGF